MLIHKENLFAMTSFIWALTECESLTIGVWRIIPPLILHTITFVVIIKSCFILIMLGYKIETHGFTNTKTVWCARQSFRMTATCMTAASFPGNVALAVGDVHEGRRGYWSSCIAWIWHTPYTCSLLVCCLPEHERSAYTDHSYSVLTIPDSFQKITNYSYVCFIVAVDALLSFNHLHVVAQIVSGENSHEILVICLALHDGIAAWDLAWCCDVEVNSPFICPPDSLMIFRWPVIAIENYQHFFWLILTEFVLYVVGENWSRPSTRPTMWYSSCWP